MRFFGPSEMDTNPYLSQLRPAALGVCTALLLGGAGFGLGCLYGQVFPAQVSVPVLLPTATTLAMGGPEELAPLKRTLAGVPAPLPTIPATPIAGQALDINRPVVGGWVSSRFGQRMDPFTGRPAVHRGLDFAGVDNSPILAVASGVVTRGGRAPGYGNFIEIDHGHGWVTRYGHNASNLVTAGDYVKPGQTIALMGSTGRATGTHLHFEVLYRGHHQNPARLLPRDT